MNPNRTDYSPSFAPPPPNTMDATQNDSTAAVAGSSNGGNGNGSGQPLALDSLSLAQLRRLASELPRSEPVAYDYIYEDMGAFDEEMDEWFSYQVWQWVRLNYAQQNYESRWERHASREHSWDEVDIETREKFMDGIVRALASGKLKGRPEVIGSLLYLMLGRWVTTAGGFAVGAKRTSSAATVARKRQLDAMVEAAALLAKVGGIPVVWKVLQEAFEPFWGSDDLQQLPTGVYQDAQDDLANLMAILYVSVQATLSEPLDMAASYVKLVSLEPSIPDFMMNIASRLRWDDHPVIPQCQVFLLLWKSLLLVFGGTKELAETKLATAESTANNDNNKNLITASPLDYHVFRQEITSKYPAYIPPQPLLPLEDENPTLLPPLPNHPLRNNGANGILPGPPNAHGGASILNQPVHIATPAPSPPPSPAAGGKGGKKQNYQTNQNFPFMYPPLDASSNGVGGKGAAALQDALVGRRWEGSDVPSSILEAGELFSTRVRMTRATRQMWEERNKFLKFERGWENVDDELIDELDLSSLTLAEKEELGLVKPNEAPPSHKKEETAADYGPRPEELNERVKQRLDALELFYGEALPHLQSLVIVLLKAILMNVAVLMAQGPPGQQHAAAGGANSRVGGLTSQGGIHGGMGSESIEMTADELDAARTREISTKAISGILLLLLKWLKVSHVLKFEYLTQLLLDCNYVPLLLKLWAHQDVQQLVDSKTENYESSFFYFCNLRAGEARNRGGSYVEVAEAVEDESEDEAAPPSIKRHRQPQQARAADGRLDSGEGGGGGGGGGVQVQSDGAEAGSTAASGAGRQTAEDGVGDDGAEDDEMITEFNRRNFFSLINLLRVMQKICKHKAHRNLLLVHYKSSNILRKMLKVPQPELRLYTLKLFKNQVPYCGRKWRQSNMRVITSVYLHCRPELRDEWLAGSDVEAEVESSLPLEQALRSLTHWFNVRRHPDKMAAEVRMALREEHDFFVRELEKMDLNWADLGDAESVMSEWDGQ